MTLNNKRRPRHERVAPAERPPFRLNARDVLILQFINDCRALTTEQVALLFFTSLKPAYGRLHKLFHHGYVERQFITQVVTAPAASRMVYTIAPLGAAVLAQNAGYSSEGIHSASRQVRTWDKLQHLLAVNDVRLALTRAVWDTAGMTLKTWRDEFQFRAAPRLVTVKTVRGGDKRQPVYPDGYAHLVTPRGEARFFWEVDLGTEGLEQIKGQIAIYQAYILSGQYQDDFQSRSLRILVVAPSQRRLDNLVKAIESQGGGERYWLTTRDQVTPAQVLNAPIWRKVGSEGLFSLIG